MKFPRLKPLEALTFGLFALYAFYFVDSISTYWFNPLYTTDDARQQAYPLYKAIYHDAFKGDPITESMMGYLAPIHWWISYLITLFTRSPVMTGHVVMFIQLTGTLVFLYKLVEQIAGRIPGLFALTWYLHTRHLPARMTGGLPRGWAGLILVAFLYYFIRRRHTAVLIVILFGILTNPPATFMCALCYGLYFVVDILRHRRNAESLRPAIRYFALCPVFAAVALISLHRPPEFGHMVNLAEAKSNPAFSRNAGRFAFLPLPTPWNQVRSVGMQAFVSNSRHVKDFSMDALTVAVFAVILLAVLWELKFKRELIPHELKFFFISIFIVYFLSRFFAFKLYVPDRHLQFPLNTFWIISFTVLIWRLFHNEKFRWRPAAALATLALVLCGFDGLCLGGSANFNTRTDQLLGLYTWVRINTPINTVIAGNPYDIDGVQLFSARPGFVTDETAHPFYTGYWRLVSKRLDVVFHAYYSHSLAQFMKAIGNEKIDYFFINRSRFTPADLARARYTRPFLEIVRKLANNAKDNNILKDLSDPRFKPAVAYDDGDGILIDVNKLRLILAAKA